MADSLISRLEKATGPDDALDRDIALAVGWIYRGQPTAAAPYTWRDPDGNSHFRPPYFTASLDAAWRLLQKGAVGFIGSDFELPGHAHVNDTFRNYDGQGANPPIAFCIACLKQRGFAS